MLGTGKATHQGQCCSPHHAPKPSLNLQVVTAAALLLAMRQYPPETGGLVPLPQILNPEPRTRLPTAPCPEAGSGTAHPKPRPIQPTAPCPEAGAGPAGGHGGSPAAGHEAAPPTKEHSCRLGLSPSPAAGAPERFDADAGLRGAHLHRPPDQDLHLQCAPPLLVGRGVCCRTHTGTPPCAVGSLVGRGVCCKLNTGTQGAKPP